MEKVEAGLYDICYILAERIRELELKMGTVEKEKEILSKVITPSKNPNEIKKISYY